MTFRDGGHGLLANTHVLFSSHHLSHLFGLRDRFCIARVCVGFFLYLIYYSRVRHVDEVFSGGADVLACCWDLGWRKKPKEMGLGGKALCCFFGDCMHAS